MIQQEKGEEKRQKMISLRSRDLKTTNSYAGPQKEKTELK